MWFLLLLTMASAAIEVEEKGSTFHGKILHCYKFNFYWFSRIIPSLVRKGVRRSTWIEGDLKLRSVSNHSLKRWHF